MKQKIIAILNGYVDHFDGEAGRCIPASEIPYIAEELEQALPQAAVMRAQSAEPLAFLEQLLNKVDADNTQNGFETTNELFRSMELEASLRHVISFIRKSTANANGA